ncbi:hypothetical protein LY78DRAFT_651665 [Colletotrichum sublineola]|nr:hypothetical protein LY78DRAFT_651665 [Colletotrichum sublineola]
MEMPSATARAGARLLGDVEETNLEEVSGSLNFFFSLLDLEADVVGSRQAALSIQCSVQQL